MMKKIKLRPLTISFVAIVVACICVAIYIANTNLKSSIDNLAFDELQSSTISQADHLQNSIGLQYAPLESLAYYLGVYDDPRAAFAEESELTDALFRANDLCMLGYADLSGNAVSYEGEDMGNISDRNYFKEVTNWTAARSIEYMATTAQTTDPRILFGVPVLKNNRLVGMLFASKEVSSFEESLFSESFNGNEQIAVTDVQGNIIAIGGNDVGHFIGTNIFEDFPSEVMCRHTTVESVLSNMQLSKSGVFCATHGEREYVCYIPLGVNDWYVFGTVQSSAVSASYAGNSQNFMHSIYILCAAFVIAFLYIIITTNVYSRRIKTEHESTRLQSERYFTILSEMKNAVFNFDIAAQKLTVSEAFEKSFGYTLPEDWLAEIRSRSKEHPEVDYEALVKAKSSVELTGKITRTDVRCQTKSKGLRWFRVTMFPLYDDNERLVNIYGLVSDITDERDEYKQMKMDQERLFLALDILSPLVISVNLTQNRFIMMKYSNFTTKAAPEEGEFDELIRIGASTCPEPDDQRFIEAFSRESLLAACARGEKKVELEHRQVGDDGIVRWMHTWVLFVNNPYDDDVYEITLARDITESKEYDELLKKTFDLTLNNIPCYTAKWKFFDGDIFLIDANDEYLEYLQTTREKAIGKSIMYSFEEKEKQAVMRIAYSCEKERKPVSFTSRAVKVDGTECWIKVQASCFEEKEGYVIYYGTVTDITELIQTQNELNRTVDELKDANSKLVATNIYRDLMNSFHDGGMMVHIPKSLGEPKFLFLSPGTLNMIGYTQQDIEHIEEYSEENIIHPDDIQQVRTASQEHTSIGDRFSLPYRVRHKDGHYFWVMEYSQVQQMPDGRAVVASLFVNITKQKELEEKYRISQEEYMIAAKLSNHAILSFDVRSKSITLISQGDSTLNFEQGATDFPEKAIAEGIIAQESIDTIRDVLDTIARGEQYGKAVVALVANDGTKHWAEIVYSLTFDDAKKPLTAIMSFEDVTAKKNAEVLFNISSAFLNYAQNSVKLLVIDLAEKTIAYETEGPHGMLTSLAGTKDASLVMQYTISQMVAPGDQHACTQFFSDTHFLNAYDGGVTEETFEYRGITTDNAVHWMNVQTRIVQDAYTKNLVVYIVFSDINEQKLAEIELLRRAQTDSLTGLMNRESFEQEIQTRCSILENRTCGHNAIIMIDVDKFKSINDTYGHDAGDATLKEVARRIKGCLREDDTVARFGGDEFIVLLPAMPSLELITKRCKKICESICYETAQGHPVSGSLGFAVCPEDGSDFNTLLKKADAAMYHAKNSGGGRCAKYSDNGMLELFEIKSTERVIHKKVFARTFGYFDLFVDGEPLHFTNAKEKELLAILIDRNGGTLTSEEAISILWENEPAGEKQLAKYRKLAMKLKNTLQNAGIDDIIVSNRGVRHIDTTKLECDYYQFLKGNPKFKKLYHDAYMTNYSWSEETIATLNNMS